MALASNLAPTRGRSIRIFLVDGSPTGLIIAEIVNWTGKAVLVPRSALPAFLKRKEAQNAGVYILSGQDPDDPFRLRVYVGESETVGKRLRQHDSDEQKDFFDRAIVFISKDENLTKAHARHLEVHLTKRMSDAGRTTPMHSNQPPGAALPEADVADMEYFLDQIEMVLPVLGLDVLRPIIATSVTQVVVPSENIDEVVELASHSAQYTFQVGATLARAVEINGEFVVKVNSIGRDVDAPALQNTYRALREQLKADGSLKKAENQTLVFTRDVPFNSTSAAACVVYGASISGPANWINESTEQTYAEVRKNALRAAETVEE
jgi:predicted GIY-YIG superfamily endonuclease